jgi:dephospho-CoA kinase
MARSGLAEPQVRAIMAAQWPRWRRLQVADDVIWNGGTPESLASQCERMHRRYVELV